MPLDDNALHNSRAELYPDVLQDLPVHVWGLEHIAYLSTGGVQVLSAACTFPLCCRTSACAKNLDLSLSVRACLPA